ncbi:MAG: hypothetical protein ACREP7_15025 [Lysobacter sp.]
MAISARISAWWLAWKWVVILAIALAASAWLNVIQWKRSITAPLRAENRAMERALDDQVEIAKDARRDNAALLQDLEQIAERGQRERIVYRKAAAATPLPAQCAPGAGRINAVNDALGPSDAHRSNER